MLGAPKTCYGTSKVGLPCLIFILVLILGNIQSDYDWYASGSNHKMRLLFGETLEQYLHVKGYFRTPASTRTTVGSLLYLSNNKDALLFYHILHQRLDTRATASINSWLLSYKRHLQALQSPSVFQRKENVQARNAL